MANSISGLNKTIKTANNRKIKDLTPVSTLPMETVRELPRPPEKQPAVIVPPTAPGAQRTVTGSAAPAQTTQAGPSGTSGASSGTGNGSGVSAPKSTVEPVDFIAPMPDAQAARRYEQAASALEGLRGQKPDYTSRYDDEITSLYEQLRGRGPFRYDSATDPLYQQYVQDYTRQGQMAMRDTMGQAAALTGGYVSSYAQSVGQQQYDAYLQRLADILPETYGMALDAYRAEGEGLSDKLRTAQTLEKSDYERYLDELGQYNRELDRAAEELSGARSEMLMLDERAYGRAEDDYARRLAAQKDAYSRMMQLIAAGYQPGEEELARAGLSREQAAALQAAATAAASASAGNRGGKNSSRSTAAAAPKSGTLNKATGKNKTITGSRKLR